MHIHIPDGVFPAWIWILSLVVLIPILTVAILKVRNDKKKLVLSSAITALMLIVFSVAFFGYHLNFTVLSGILLGPFWSLISITIANIFLSLFGHGGVTVTPLNILINWAEALVGFFFVGLIFKKVKNANKKSLISSISVIIALVFSFILFLGVIQLTNINPGLQLHDHSHGHDDAHELGEAEHAFEWAGAFTLTPGQYNWSFEKVEGEYADLQMKFIFLQANESDLQAIESLEELAEEIMGKENAINKYSNEYLVVNNLPYLLNFDENSEKTIFFLNISEARNYVFFTQHLPFEFENRAHFLLDKDGNEIESFAEEPEHSHDEEYVPLKEFAMISAIPLLIAAIIEAFLTFLIVSFLIKVKPKIFE